MRALVSGGAGFIGSNLVRQLIAAGHEVLVLDDLSSGYMKNLDFFADGQFIRADVRSGPTLGEAVKGRCHLSPGRIGGEQAVHRSPFSRFGSQCPGHAKRPRSGSGRWCRKVVFSSSAGIFGELKTVPPGGPSRGA